MCKDDDGDEWLDLYLLHFHVSSVCVVLRSWLVQLLRKWVRHPAAAAAAVDTVGGSIKFELIQMDPFSFDIYDGGDSSLSVPFSPDEDSISKTQSFPRTEETGLHLSMRWCCPPNGSPF